MLCQQEGQAALLSTFKKLFNALADGVLAPFSSTIPGFILCSQMQMFSGITLKYLLHLLLTQAIFHIHLLSCLDLVCGWSLSSVCPTCPMGQLWSLSAALLVICVLALKKKCEVHSKCWFVSITQSWKITVSGDCSTASDLLRRHLGI